MPAAMNSKEFEPLGSGSQGEVVKSDDQPAAAGSLARNYHNDRMRLCDRAGCDKTTPSPTAPISQRPSYAGGLLQEPNIGKQNWQDSGSN